MRRLSSTIASTATRVNKSRFAPIGATRPFPFHPHFRARRCVHGDPPIPLAPGLAGHQRTPSTSSAQGPLAKRAPPHGNSTGHRPGVADERIKPVFFRRRALIPSDAVFLADRVTPCSRIVAFVPLVHSLVVPRHVLHIFGDNVILRPTSVRLSGGEASTVGRMRMASHEHSAQKR